jgi:hypothetical protein
VYHCDGEHFSENYYIKYLAAFLCPLDEEETQFSEAKSHQESSK